MADFEVRNRRMGGMKLIPYVGCKAGFVEVFDTLLPKNPRRIYDVFGGGGGFAFYACRRFGAKRVIFNDHNPVITNLIRHLARSPSLLYDEYEKHRRKSSREYYLTVRDRSIDSGIVDAGRFYYLAKNAFSGKIRFNSKNRFNSPMRKGAKCPRVSIDDLKFLSNTIRGMSIRCRDFYEYRNVSGAFVYLDPPYLFNKNGHYNAIISPERFVRFVSAIQAKNKVMISEQNGIRKLGIIGRYSVHRVRLRRSLQYFTRSDSQEIVAINYKPN